MNALVYNVALLVGVGLIGFGVAQWSIPHACVTVGALVIALTLFGALITTRRGGK